ncbi:NADase-type glycan-binding domain-containing protein [Streptomyces sp. NPDC059787]|uniref:NADase-type glycan-binding domain-containing protein n=1 Tax=Streptomyces sp. NPDC059787 TaxID=3346947 RepID=UPI00364B947D
MTSQSSGPGRAAPSCAECGTPAEPGQSFCDSCGAVLGWADDGRPGRTEPTARTTTAPGAGTGSARTDAGHGDGPGDRGRAAIPRPRTAPADSGTPRTAPAAAPAATSAPAPAVTSHADDRAAVPGTPPSPAPHGPGDGHEDGPDHATGTSPDRPRDRRAAVPGTPPSPAPHGPGDGHDDGPDHATGTTPPAPDGPHAHRADERPPVTPAAPYTTAPDDDTEPLPSVTDSPEPSQQHPHHDDAAERARSLLVPVADPEPRAPEEPDVAPVLPGRPVAHRPQVRAVGPQSDAEGGVPCPWCSTLNRPERHYCSRCAMSMTRGEDTPERLPWWRRMFGARDAESAWAGERPRLRRGFGHIWNWVVAAVVIGLAVALIVNLGAMIQATRDHFAKRAPIGPSSVKASRSFSEHGAPLAFDKLNNTWWGPGIAQAAEGEWLEATFDRPTRLLDLVITPGTSTKPDQLSKSALPRQLDALITLADGKKITRTITLDQGAGGQRRKFRVGEVTAVRFVLRSAYGADPKKQVAIAEIEFFGPSSNNT